nr:sulfatase [uncultured Pedobacter sp.]
MKHSKNLFFLLFLILSNEVYGQKKPNILWITIEDTSPQFIGSYGNKDARTPNIDKLAKDGIKFINAFSTGTVCSPSRSTLITGVRTFELGTGHHRSSYPIPDFIHGFPYYLKQNGYYTSNNSKTDYNIKAGKQFIADAWDESSTKAGWEKRKSGQPFFAVFNYMDSHQSRTMTDPYNRYLEEVLNKLPETDRIAETDFQMPPFYRDSPEMRKQFARVYNSLKLTDNKIGQLLNRLQQDNLRDSTIIFFFADHGEGIPRAKTNGINLGYRVPFVIWFPEMYKNLSPWGKAGAVSSELIDFEDLAPTLISLAGGKVPPYLKGRILMGEKRSQPTDHLLLSSDRSDNSPDLVRSITNGQYVYSRNYMPYMPETRYIRYMEVSDIKKQMREDLKENKLNALQRGIFDPRPSEFLFDITNDPWETKNLINDSKVQKLVAEMRNQLHDGILKSRDVMLLPEYEMALISKTKTPYEFRLDNINYPINEIYQAFSLSGKRDKNVAMQQIKLLKSKNKIVRYWAATGLFSQNPEVLKMYKEQILNAMTDAYPPVAITISAIAWQNFNSELAAENLKKYIMTNNQDLALMAINFLIYTNNKLPFLEDIKTVNNLKTTNYNVKSACFCFLQSLGDTNLLN